MTVCAPLAVALLPNLNIHSFPKTNAGFTRSAVPNKARHGQQCQAFCTLVPSRALRRPLRTGLPGGGVDPVKRQPQRNLKRDLPRARGQQTISLDLLDNLAGISKPGEEPLHHRFDGQARMVCRSRRVRTRSASDCASQMRTVWSPEQERSRWLSAPQASEWTKA